MTHSPHEREMEEALGEEYFAYLEESAKTAEKILQKLSDLHTCRSADDSLPQMANASRHLRLVHMTR